MKKLTVIIAAFAMLGMAATSQAQTPQGIKYQAIARTSSGEVIANRQVTFRISILVGSAEGTIVYQETQAATTNPFGLANLNIGMGNVVLGIFDSIPWGNGTYFAKVEFDPQGGTNFAIMGTSQLLSVPYSLYAAHAKVADNMPVYPITAGLLSTNWPNPFTNPETGLLVYNTDSAGKVPFNVIPGYYYNAGTPTNPNWVMLSTANSAKFGDNGPGFPNYNDWAVDAGLCATCGQDNSAWGYEALGGNSGNNNTACGYNALNLSSSTSNDNSAIGYWSGLYNTGSGNVGVGESTLYYNTGNNNVAVGNGSLSYNNLGGSQNVAVGYNSMSNVNGGNDNTATGAMALTSNTTGTNNVANGFGSLTANLIGIGNVANGSGALGANTTGYYNVANGFNALSTNSTGYFNVANGYLASPSMGSGFFNTANGSQSLYNNIAGSSNVADGNLALPLNVRSWNTAVGDSAGYSDVSGTFDTYLGYQTYNSGTTTNATAIGYYAEVCKSNSMSFGNGNVTSWNFGLCQPCTSGAVISVNVPACGGVYMNCSGSWATCSDRNKKTNFTVINKEEVLNKVLTMPVTQWNYKWDLATLKHIGPMAQDFYKAFQLNDDSLHILTIDEAGVAFAAIQALNEKLETENALLKAQIVELTQLAARQDARSSSEEKQIAEIKVLVNLNQAQASSK